MFTLYHHLLPLCSLSFVLTATTRQCFGPSVPRTLVRGLGFLCSITVLNKICLPIDALSKSCCQQVVVLAYSPNNHDGQLNSSKAMQQLVVQSVVNENDVRSVTLLVEYQESVDDVPIRIPSAISMGGTRAPPPRLT